MTPNINYNELKEILSNEELNLINVESNLKEYESHFNLHFNLSLLINNTVFDNIISRLFWINDNYLKSIKYEDSFTNPALNEYTDSNLTIDFSFNFNEFFETYKLRLLSYIKDKKNISFTDHGSYVTFIKSDFSKEDLKNTIEEFLNTYLKNYLKNFLDSNGHILTKKYIFTDINSGKESFVNIDLNYLTFKVKISNSNKVIDALLLKRAVNRLSIISQRLNDGFSRINFGKATYKIMYAGRRNAFEEINRSIVESIIKGI